MGERKREKRFFYNLKLGERGEKGITCSQEEDASDIRGKAPMKPKWKTCSQIKDGGKYVEA